LGGTALSFHNHDNDNASYGSFVIGGIGSENDFNADINKSIYLITNREQVLVQLSCIYFFDEAGWCINNNDFGL
jgi:hypothetical protein